ncbi:MATE family efflux transporter [Rickettsia endosymbiont of Gonocerus acuteangulatus]|uniref:MATE family efflux transporter n=1 Tax=Rickettsia endosymbiont of Gonocerus acuteangulatus TaxID=3066266 RepID=UPI003132EC51
MIYAISSMGSGFMILGGKALGNKNIKKFEAYNQYNKFLLLIVSGILALPLLFLSNKVLRILTSFNDIAHYAHSSTILLAFTLPLLAIYFSKATYLRLIERVKLDMVCNIFSLWFVQIPTAYCLIVYFQLGLISFSIAFVIHQISYIIISSKIQRLNSLYLKSLTFFSNFSK